MRVIKLTRLTFFILAITSLIGVSWAQEKKPEDLYKSVLPSVMTLNVDKRNGATNIGTAFLVSKEGLAITAWHVVSNAKRVIARFSSGEEFDVSGIVDKDERRDVALIRVKVFGKQTLSFTKTEPAVGSKVYVIGSPKGFEFS